MINIVIMISSIFLFVNTAAADSSKSKNIDGMVFIKGGCFQMGDSFGDGYAGERPVHEVCVNDFYIGEAEVTQGEWKVFMAENPSVNKWGDNYPVDSVDWEDVQEFIKKMNVKTGKSYRLPTEAEWEYAARSGGRKDKFAGTNDESVLEEYAWYYKNSDNETHPVKQKKPNALGLYDMSGNVWEWASDLYDGSYYEISPKDNPKGPDNGMYHMLRGGSWYSEAKNVRTTDRYWTKVGGGGTDTLYGFRLAMSAD
ncbi:MAG TPA: formylglycine-generating enzyme family protein [Nitrospinae bacterium]|nr:formylglycine-generating enzyme family protein [Nitrospinota bacterium]HBA27700.1 formylglycine-generating enzyme family protein [Nitrospinota bacterium]